MSTRTNIRIIGHYGSILLYKHHDGYPSNMLPFLNGYMKRHCHSGEHLAEIMMKESECRISESLHGDIEYYYEMDIPKETIRSFKVYFDTGFKNQKMERIFPEEDIEA